MAQAARLNLRMQKELKLLLTDPPPNASFPSLSDEYSLTSIDAHLRGPEGTVYADGVFKIKIKIPERYPFQPPVVTFGTRVYHPNIDDGGRICLDILNLPPKGSWQPSLNISTVLTSIGLLLSEPNPDDGLMHDASREYKYNREVFDQKARSMTEKYARVGESESATSGHDTEAHTGPSTVKTESEGPDAPECSTEHFKRQKRFGGSSRKLSLESFGSSSNKDNDKGIDKVPNHDYLKNHAETGLTKEAETVVTEFSRNPNKLQVPRHKLSLKVSGLSHTGNGQSTKTNMENHCLSLLENQTPSSDSPDSSSLAPAGHNHELVSCRDEDNTESCSMSFNQEEKLLESVKANLRSEDSGEKLHLMPQHAVSQLDSAKSRQALSRPLITNRNSKNPPKDAIDRIESGSTRYRLEDKKENLAPNEHLLPKPADQSGTSCMVPSIVSENYKYYNERTGKQGLNVVKKQLGLVSKLPRKPLNQLPDSNKKLKLHTENSSSRHSQFLHERSDVRPDVKQQTNQGHDGESIDKLKQPSGSSPIPEVAIVLDSEDSEEENVPVRSKLSLARKCLSRKPKFNV